MSEHTVDGRGWAHAPAERGEAGRTGVARLLARRFRGILGRLA